MKTTPRPERLALGGRYLAYLLILVPVVLSFLYVHRFGINVPFGDTWTMVDRFDKLSRGTLTFNDLWVQHYEHRLFFPRIALLALGVPTAFDNVAAMYLMPTSLLLTLIVLGIAFRRTLDPAHPLFFVPIAFVVFTLAQWFNMLSAIQIAFGFAQASGVLALYLLYVSQREGARRLAFPAALAGAIVASFSFLPGLFVWPAGLLQILVSPVRGTAKKVLAGVWGLGWIVAWAAYLYRLVTPRPLEGSYFYNNPSLGLDYLLTALGSPLTRQPTLALVGGLAVVCLAVAALFFLYRSGKLREGSFWVGLLAFSLIILAAQTAGRGGGGAESALQSRYITFTSLALVSIYAMLVKLYLERTPWHRSVVASLGILCALILVSVPFSYAYGIGAGRDLETKRGGEISVLSTYQSQPDDALNIANRGSRLVRTKAFVLCKLGYSVFSEPGVQERNCLPPPFSTLSPVGSSTSSKLESISGRRVDQRSGPLVVSPRTGSVEISGWAVDAEGEKPAGGVYIEIDSEQFPAFYGRADRRAVTRLGNPAYAFSGFELTIPLSEIGTGKHKLSVIVVSSDRKRYYQSDREVVFEVRR